MTEVISVKFKNHGKCYFFDPKGLTVTPGERVVVETAKGLELAECSRGNHPVEDTAVVLPLRPVVRSATEADLRVSEINKKREKEAFGICEKKIVEHGLEMKLVDVECNFEGNKTTFFFTADGRVDFRDLVKDLAGIFRNRIELRQIGVRDEAKMLGGLGICGRPYCCSQFLDDFQPVSTKMAKVQNLSLNPTKISGSCGRLMCCLRYEQSAYEDLISKSPKLGAFVETPAGYGCVSQVNLLRQNVKVKLDGEGDDVIRTYSTDEVATVPGGRPQNGEKPASVLKFVPKVKVPEEPEDDGWTAPNMLVQPVKEPDSAVITAMPDKKHTNNNNRRRRNGARGHGAKAEGAHPATAKQPGAPRQTATPKPPVAPKQPGGPKPEKIGDSKPRQPGKNYHRRNRKPKPKTGGEPPKT